MGCIVDLKSMLLSLNLLAAARRPEITARYMQFLYTWRLVPLTVFVPSPQQTKFSGASDAGIELSDIIPCSACSSDKFNACPTCCAITYLCEKDNIV